MANPKFITFKYRDHRGSLSASMETVKEFHSKNELIKHLQSKLNKFHPGKYDLSRATIEKYGDGIDDRIGWDTHIVHLEGYGVLGFTDRGVETSG